MPRSIKKERGVFQRPKASGIWWIRYWDQNGREHREMVGMKSAALAMYAQRKTEVRMAKFLPEEVKGKHQRATVAEIIDDYVEAGKSRKLKAIEDVKQRLGWFRQQIGGLPARSVTANDIEACRRRLNEGRLPSNKQKTVKVGGRAVATVNRYLATLKSAFYLALKSGKVDKNPVSLVKLSKENNKRVRWLTEEEEVRLLSVLPTAYRLMVLVALHTGMRKSEQLNLEWTDVDFRRNLITIKESKAGEPRHMPMNQVVIEALQSLPRMLHNPFVFFGREEGQPLHNGIKHSDWQKYLKQARIKNLRWHDLRHTFASRLVMRGIDLYTVSKLLGHHSTEMTERYTHLAPNYLKNAVNALVLEGQNGTSLTAAQ
jgi:integrase